AKFYPTPDTVCLGTMITFADSSYAIDSTFNVAPSAYSWRFGDGGTAITDSPSHTYNAAGKYFATLIVSDAMGCEDSLTKAVFVIQLHIQSFHDTTLCISQPLPMQNIIISNPVEQWQYQYVWTQSAPNLSDTSVQIPFLTGIGLFVDTLTVTIPGVPPDGCPARDTIMVHSVLGKVLTQVTTSQTINYGSSVQLNSNNEVFYYWKPNDGSLDNPNINNPVATPGQTTIYTVYGLDDNGCLDSASVTIYVDST